MSPSVNHNSPWHSADLWWCFPPSCSYPTLLFPGLAPSVQWRIKALESPFLSVSISSGNSCFTQPSSRNVALLALCSQVFAPSLVKHPVSHLALSWATAALQQVLWLPPSQPPPQLSLPFATSCLGVSPGPCPCFGCSRPCCALWDHTHPFILPLLEKLTWLYKLPQWKMSFPSNMAP